MIFPAVAVLFRRRPLWIASAMFAAALAYRYATANCCLEVQIVSRQMPAYADVFAAGMLAAYVVVWGRARLPALDRYRLAATAVAVACVCLAFGLLASANGVQYEPGGRERWDLGNRTLVALGAGGLIVASCFAHGFWRALVANRLLLFFSLISYNLYLWHTLVMIWMWKHGVPHATTADPHADNSWKAGFIALGWSASIGIATAVTYFFERPLLATVRRQSFAFDWSTLVRRLGVRGPRPIGKPERRT